MRALTIFVCFVLACYQNLHSQEAIEHGSNDHSTEDRESSAVIISAIAELTERSRNRGRSLHVGITELGSLMPNTYYLVRISIQNKSESDFSFSKAGTGCKCRSFKIEGNFIPAGGALAAEILFKTPDHTMHEVFQNGVEFILDGKAVGSLACRGEMAGMLALDKQELHIEYSKIKSQKLKIPFLFTPPIGFQELSVKADTPIAKYIDVSLEQLDEKNGVLVLEKKKVLDENSLADLTSIFGDVELSHKVLQLRRSLSLVFSKQKDVQINPSLLRFHREPAGKRVSAVSIIRLSNDMELSGKTNISASFSGKPLKVDRKALTERIHRVSVSAHDSLIRDEEATSISWLITVGDRQYKVKTLCELVE